MTITRRKLLSFLPALGMAGLIGPVRAADQEISYLERLFRDPAAARRLGAACRSCGLKPTRDLPDTAGLSFRQWHARLDRQIRGDFADGRMALVEGIYLSETEISTYQRIAQQPLAG